MKERPILFSAPMVRALLDGTKTQTRRVVKHRSPQLWQEPYYPTGKVRADLPTQPGAFMEFRSRLWDEPAYQGSTASFLIPCPYGMPGERLWVREAIRLFPDQGPGSWIESFYDADGTITKADAWPWKRNYLPPMHCPRGLSRIDLEVTGVRVERLQDISEADAIAEGIDTKAMFPWRPDEILSTNANVSRYAVLWESINGAGSWDANPWVWVVAFKTITKGTQP